MSAHRLPRRALFALPLVSLVVACRHDASSRCATCGMKIDPASAWRSELVTPAGTLAFDSPRCAFLAWRTNHVAASALRVQDFYDRVWHDASELRFAVGSDVVGPMGADLVPVDVTRAAKFALDHRAARVIPVADVTADVLASLG